MPDPFDFDDARRALDEVPAPDLWDEASRRAAGGAVVPLDSLGDPRRPRRWLAAAGVAAVAVLAVGTTAVLLDDDDKAVDTTPVTEPPSASATMVGGGDVCLVGISGDPITMQPGPADPPLFDTSGQPEGQLVAHTMLGAQVAELHVPGLVLDDLLGERVDDVELARGTASVWFGPDFVQVRWFTGGQERCESFTVTVAGGTEDGNRHAAVDLAERVLLPSDLGASAVELEGTEWQLERSTVDGIPTDGNGALFVFADGEAGWSDGCQSFGASYTQPSPNQLVLGDISSTERACPTNPTSDAILAVMSSGAIEVELNDLLVLSGGGGSLTLRPAERSSPDDTPSAGPELAGTEWRVAALYRGDELVVPRPDTGELTFSFSDSQVGWDDGCNSASGIWSVDPDGYLVVTDAVSTAVLCADEGEGTQAWEVIRAVMGSERIYMDEMGGVLELSDTEGNHIALEPA